MSRSACRRERWSGPGTARSGGNDPLAIGPSWPTGAAGLGDAWTAVRVPASPRIVHEEIGGTSCSSRLRTDGSVQSIASTTCLVIAGSAFARHEQQITDPPWNCHPTRACRPGDRGYSGHVRRGRLRSADAVSVTTFLVPRDRFSTADPTVGRRAVAILAEPSRPETSLGARTSPMCTRAAASPCRFLLGHSGGAGRGPRAGSIGVFGVGDPARRSRQLRQEVKRWMNTSAVSATSRQPLSMVRAWPRFGISTNSVTPSLCFCRL